MSSDSERAGDRVAVKLEQTGLKNSQLPYESRILKALQGGVGIPKLVWYG